MKKHHTTLLGTIQEKIDLTEKEIEILIATFQLTYKKKNEYLIKKGQTSLNLFFIKDGYARSYDIDDEGNDITTHISTNNDFVTHFEGFVDDKPAKENIQCVSDCILLSISKTNYLALYSEIAHWSVFCQSVYESHILKMADRVHSLQSLSATDRYLKLLKTQPNIALYSAVKHLASYLGIQPQSLSRIRKEIK